MKKPTLDSMLAQGLITQAQYDAKLASIQADRANRQDVRAVITGLKADTLGTNVARIAELESNVLTLAQQLLKIIKAN